MTDPIVRLETSALSVEPGGQGRTLVTVRNLGTIVEGFRLEVLGEGVGQWAEVSPPEVQVYPEQEATAVVVFSPPAGNTTRSGTFPFAVRAESVVDPAVSAVAEGDLEIGRVFGLQSKITPVTSTGRWRGKHFIEITNWGNAPVRLKLAAADPDEKLAFLIGPESMDLPLGVTGHAQVRVRTLAPFLRGSQVRVPFQVVAEPDPPEVPTGPPSMIPNPRRTTLDGAFVQRPILSKLTVTLATVLVLALGGLVAFLVTRDSTEGPAALAQGSPRTPALSAVSGGPSSVQLLWEPQPNIQSYRINQLTADGRTAGVVTVDGALTTFVVQPLEPDAEFCFQLQAVRGEQVSPLSETRCARTAVAPPPSASAAGSASAGSAPASESAGASASAAVSGPATASGQASVPPTSGGQGAVVIPPGGGGGGTTTPGGGGATAPGGSGATTAGGGGTAGSTAPGGGQAFAPGQYIDVVFTIPASDAEAAGRAEFRRQQFVAAGIPAAVLRTTDYPDLQLVPGLTPVDSYLVYVGPFASAQEAQARCTAQPPLGTLCRPVQPNPAS
jgi:hypothetical protein